MAPSHSHLAEVSPSPKKKRKGSPAKQAKKDSVVVKTPSRNLACKYGVSAQTRGHCKEYGDPTCYPCGSMTNIDSHYRDCPACDSCRFVMDAWESKNNSVGEDFDIEPVPALTMAGIKEVCGVMGVPLTTLRGQKITWTPYEGVKKWSAAKRKETMTESFVECWRKMDPADKARCLRPKLPNLDGAEVNKDTFETMPATHHMCNAKVELLEYIVMQAKQDGFVPDVYIKKVAANFGAVPDVSAGAANNDEHDELSKYVAFDVSDLLATVEFADDSGGVIGLERFGTAPRLLKNTAEKVTNMPFATKASRVADHPLNIPGNANGTNNNNAATANAELMNLEQRIEEAKAELQQLEDDIEDRKKHGEVFEYTN